MKDTLENSPYSKLLNDIFYDFVRCIFIMLWLFKETLTITIFFLILRHIPNNSKFLHIGKLDYA